MKLLVALGGDAIKQAGQAGMTAEQSADCDEAAGRLAAIVSRVGPDDRLTIARGNDTQSGSTGPRMASDITFVQDGRALAIISSLGKTVGALGGKTGTRVVPDAPARKPRASRKGRAVSLR